MSTNPRVLFTLCITEHERHVAFRCYIRTDEPSKFRFSVRFVQCEQPLATLEIKLRVYLFGEIDLLRLSTIVICHERWFEIFYLSEIVSY